MSCVPLPLPSDETSIKSVGNVTSRFIAAGKWPLDAIDGDPFEGAEPPPLPLGPGQSFAERKVQVPLTRYAMLPPGSTGNVALTRAWVRLIQIPNLLPGPRKEKTAADKQWAKELVVNSNTNSNSNNKTNKNNNDNR